MKAIKQQTAVEWLVKQLRKYGSPVPREFEEKAKAMEKKQIIDSYESGIEEGRMRESSEEYNLEYYENAEQYYTETYETKDQ